VAATSPRPRRRRPRLPSGNAGASRLGSGGRCWCRSQERSRSVCGVGGATRARESRHLSLLQMSRYYLTTPIYYVNSSPHIGHAYTTIAADILVRHHRQRGDETFFLTGTDENASKNVRAAEEAGVDPKTFVDRLVEEDWRPLPGRVGASPDFFIRTTDEGHHPLVQGFVARSYARPNDDLRDEFWPEARHLIGKDILRFRCVFWPALLLAAGYEVPKQIFVHGWLLFDNRKISKSSGNAIEPLELVDLYGVDPLRYYVARVTRFGQDGNASVDDLHERYERELGNDLGNLLSRTTAMIARYREGALVSTPWGSPFRAELEQLAREAPDRLDDYDLSGALEAAWLVIRSLNRYVEERAPWQLAKDEARAEELDRTLYDLADGLRAVAIALAAYLPETARRILTALRQPDDLAWEEVAYGRTRAAEGITAAEPLFPRVELETAVA